MKLWMLMRKDLRLCRIAIVGGAALLVAMYALAVAFWMNARLGGHTPGYGWPEQEFAGWLNWAARFGYLMIMVTAAVFGGMSFALERRERWAEFLGMLPPHRLMVIASKLLVAWASLAALWLVNSFILLFTWALDPRLQRNGSELDLWAGLFPLTFFGIAWLCSTFLTSPAISAGISIAVTFFGTITISTLLGRSWWDVDAANRLTTHVAWASGLLAWLAGTICYVRRVAP